MYFWENDLFVVLRWTMAYLNQLHQSLPVFNLNNIIEWTLSCFLEGLNGIADKIDVKMEQNFKKITQKSCITIRTDSWKRKNVKKETDNNSFL